MTEESVSHGRDSSLLLRMTMLSSLVVGSIGRRDGRFY